MRARNCLFGGTVSLKSLNIWHKNRVHHGVVLNVSIRGFDMGSATFGSVFVDEDNPDTIFLFYSGAQDVNWSRVTVGLAKSHDGFSFKKTSDNPILEGVSGSFCYKEVSTPAVARVGNRFFMIFSGRASNESSKRIGIAYSGDPGGPWYIIGELVKPTHLWEGKHIENGPSLVKLDDETFLVFYSNITTRSIWDVLAVLRRYPIRRIGVAKVRILGTSMSSIEVHRLETSPLKHLNSKKGSWNESLFCPGYFPMNDTHYLLPAASTYSASFPYFPYKQYVGIVSSNSPFFNTPTTQIQKLIDGPSEKSLIIPDIKSEIALDTPSPFLNKEKNKLFLYYSVADYADYIWKIALSTFDITHARGARARINY